MSNLKSLDARLAEIRGEYGKNTTRTNEEILDTYTGYCPLWEEYLGKSLTGGMVVVLNDVKYLVMQDIATVLESQAPDDEGMLALYKPYRDSGVYEWLYGEYVEIGWVRTYNGVSYTAIQDPNANIYSPDLVPAVWEVEDNFEEVL